MTKIECLNQVVQKQGPSSLKENVPVYLASALMGAGKTTSMIENLEDDRNYVIAVPKIGLANDIVSSLTKETDLSVDAIHSDNGREGSVKNQLDLALSEGRQGSVIVTTQVSLVSVDSQWLEGWTVILDEVPVIADCKSITQGYSLFKDQFQEYIEVDKELNCSFDTSNLNKVTIRHTEAKRDRGTTPAKLMYEGLLSKTAKVQLEDHEGRWLIKKTGYVDWSRIIEDSLEFHVMGADIESTLFYLWLQAKKYELRKSEFTPCFQGYDLSPVLVPMVKGEKFSKELMLTRVDGSKASKFDRDCYGWKVLEAAMEYHKNDRVLVQVYSWMADAFPFRLYPNATVTEFDVRGLNGYRDHHRTVNIFHGNPTPIEARMNEEMFEMMGVDPKLAREAVRHERLVMNMAQHILRTDMRNIGSQEEATITIVPTLGIAKSLEKVLQIKCDIDTSVMMTPPKSKAKSRKAELVAQALRLSASGMTHRQIAKTLGKSHPTVSRWLKSA